MNVLPAWQQSYHGEGILVGVVDDGVFKNHPDLATRVNHGSSHNFVSVQGSAWPWSPWSDPNDPTPSSESESHGTRCAGIIAAQENNNICGVGVAYGAEIAGQ
ncbi:PREDICTED: neuroendocrine convertase 2-like [Branchiostoma belcheri]|uniref:Neuroendocrine convertase 2-like n=1 Tax=Branchiostoma belcheri TaxID=7741 RepID=A0A6P4ZR80_BRABE|nr:PREDICTED: neuroendocrine convertase 2-like [Branchiostoma belcheri]